MSLRTIFALQQLLVVKMLVVSLFSVLFVNVINFLNCILGWPRQDYESVRQPLIHAV